jgi:hypothetical protein
MESYRYQIMIETAGRTENGHLFTSAWSARFQLYQHASAAAVSQWCLRTFDPHYARITTGRFSFSIAVWEDGRRSDTPATWAELDEEIGPVVLLYEAE